MKPWIPRSDWESLKSGVGCPMCSDLADPAVRRPGHVNRHGHTIADLPCGVLRLSVDQFSAGYCVLIAKHHGPEPHHLPPEQRAGFFEDLTSAGRAIERACGADKLNFQLLGNAVPHLHAHLVPRYHGDPAGGSPLLGGPDGAVRATHDEYLRRTTAIREALSA